MSNFNKPSFVILIIFLVVLGFLTVFFNLNTFGEQQFTYLAKSFLQGKTYFLEQPTSWADTVYFNNRYYWPLGPFPAVFLIPFVLTSQLFGVLFPQGYLQVFLVGFIYVLIYRLARRLKYKRPDSHYLAYGFLFSTAFIGVAMVPFSWWFAHVIVVFLSFLALYEFETKKRFAVIGIYLAAILATRQPAFLLLIYFLLRIPIKKNIIQLAKLLVPSILTFALLLWYNYLRFGNIFEQGYSNQILVEALVKARDYGLFNIVHIPGNLYYLFLSGPQIVLNDNLSHVLSFPFIKANPWGMSIFITSPIFIYFLKYKFKDKISYAVIGSVIAICIPILMYYGIGYRQFGYRYSLDFLPLLYWLLMYKCVKIKPLSGLFKATILISSFVNLYLFLTFIYLQ